MGKRDRNHDSRDDSKSPLPSKRVNSNKQTNLDKFFNVSANSSLQSVKADSNSGSLKLKTTPKSQPNDQRVTYQKKQIPQELQNKLMQQYLSLGQIHICTEPQCLQEITSEDKFFVQGQLKCLKCAKKLTKTEYIVIKSLENASYPQFQLQRKQDDRVEYKWNFEDQLKLIQAMDKFGVDSYELIKEYMKTDHTIEDIKQHILELICMFNSGMQQGHMPKIKMEGLDQNVFNEQSELNQQKEEIPYIDSSQIIFPQIDRPPKMEVKKQSSLISKQKQRQKYWPKQDYEMTKRHPDDEQLLSVLRYNEKRRQFEHHLPGLYELLLSHLSEQDISEHPEQADFFMRGYDNQLEIRRREENFILQKTKPRALFGKDQNSQGQQSSKIQAEESSEQASIMQIMGQDDEWTYIGLQMKQKYSLFGQKDDKKADLMLRRMKLSSRLIEIKNQAEQELIQMKNNCTQTLDPNLSLQQFQSKLPRPILQVIYKMDELLQIKNKLEQLEQQQREAHQMLEQ